MLRGKLTRPAIAGVALLLTACGGSDGLSSVVGNEFQEAVVEPGITALQDAPAAACDAEYNALQKAIELYEVMHGELPTEEADLVGTGLRTESERWDLVDGSIVPAATDASPCLPR